MPPSYPPNRKQELLSPPPPPEQNGDKLTDPEQYIAPDSAEYVLGSSEGIAVSTHDVLVQKPLVKQEYGIDGNIVAIIVADDKVFSIIDSHDIVNKDFILADGKVDIQNQKHFKGISPNELLTIGRNHLRDRFDYPNGVSRDHFQVLYDDDQLYIKNLNPTNQTTVITSHSPHDITSTYTHTFNAQRGVQHNSPSKTAYGEYYGHPIIGRDSAVRSGSVYLNQLDYDDIDGEICLVDGESEAIKKLYAKVYDSIVHQPNDDRTTSSRHIASIVMHAVRDAMPYNMLQVNYMAERARRARGMVKLSSYLDHGGVCRQQGLMSAYLLQSLIDNNVIPGEAHVERNDMKDISAGHAWATYQPNPDQPFKLVVDPAQDFVGTKEEALRQYNRWDYYLDGENRTDVRRRIAQNLGAYVVNKSRHHS